jgi:hypothetical protein
VTATKPVAMPSTKVEGVPRVPLRQSAPRHLKRGRSRAGRAGAAVRAAFDVDVEDPFEQPGPAHARRFEDHRRHRRSARDRQDPQLSGPTDPRPPRALARRVDLFQTI